MNFCVSSFLATIAIECLTATVLHATVFYVDPETGSMDNDGSATDFVIENNTLYSSADALSWSAKQWDSMACYGISVIAERVKIRNNTLRYVNYGITIGGCQNGVIVNNLAYNPYGGDFFAGIMLGTTHGKTASENTVVRNNLVDSKINAPGKGHTIDHNIIVSHPVRYFRDMDNFDMRHKEGSPAIDAGSAELAPETDIEGVKRPQGAGIDVGPYERKEHDEEK